MGIFEWLALTLQEDPSKLSPRDHTVLAANRLITDQGQEGTPACNFEPLVDGVLDRHMEMHVFNTANHIIHLQPRLTVL